ncbi:hypothetical protein B0H11DRAFT_1187027 [Mycena galericulata]|nr:hypothetical protein B0H11DRAFT_1187027 [Mycena galericulata]
MLHCTNMLLVTSHRFLTRQKTEKIIEISTKIATALKQGQDGNGASGSSAGPGSSGSGSGTDRPRGGGGSGGPDGSGSGSGAGRGHVGLGGSGSSGSSGGRKRGAAGGSDEMGGGSSAVLGGGSTHVEGHGDGEVESEKGDDEELDIRPRKRARTQQLLTPSTSAESNLSPSGGPIGTFSLKSLLEEIQEPTQRPETGFSDAEGKDEELRSALFEKHPHLKRWETTDNLWDYHTGIVKEGALLLYLIGGLVQNSLSQKIDMSGGDEDGEE